MSGEELRTRLAQEANKRLDRLRGFLRLSPAMPRRRAGAAQKGKFFFDPADAAKIAAQIKKQTPGARESLRAQAEKILDRRFDLLGYERLDFGREIDWSLDPVSGRSAPLRPWPTIPYLDYTIVGDHKVTWELGRHQHLTTLARAWRVTGETRFRDEALKQWRGWREANLYPNGIHWTSALEVAFRAISWLWLDALLDDSGPDGKAVHQELEEACGHSALYLERYLSYYFSPNTHLLGEAVALYALGQVFRGFEAAERWRDTGRRVVLEQAAKQVRGDGLYFEQSLYYHVYALDFLVFFRLIAQRNDDPLPVELAATTELMADMLLRLAQGGAAPRFGDDDGGRLFDPHRNRNEHMLDPLAVCALLHGRADLKAAAGEMREETIWLTGLDGCKRWDALVAAPAKPSAYRHDEGGWHVLVSGELPPRALILDAGPLGALSGGHGHADALSVQCIRNGRPWLTDPGAGRYPSETPERDVFRSTAAHSTLRVDGRGQAEPRGSFGWDSMPESVTEMFLDAQLLDFAVARHKGYERLPEPVTHRRWALLLHNGLVFVRDVAEGRGRHALEQIWRIGPDFRLAALAPGEVRLATEDGDLLTCVSPQSSDWSREIFEADWSPCYGVWQGAPVVQFSADIEVPCERAVALAPGRTAEARTCSLEQLADGKGQGLSAYRYSDGVSVLTLYFADKAGEWRMGPLRSDARLLAWESDAKGGRLLAAFGSFLEVEGEMVFREAAAVERFEWSAASGADSSSAASARGAKTGALEKLVSESLSPMV